MTNLILYSYYRSSCAYRVRIALHFKELEFEYRPIHLVRDGGEQLKSDYLALNPLGQVPCLVHNGKTLSQSMAILLYLDTVYPDKTLFPTDPFDRAQVMQLCEAINSGIQPIQNLAVLKALEADFGANGEAKGHWAHYWIARGFKAFERMLEKTAGDFCFGNKVSAADALLVPQVYNANRFKVDLTAYPKISEIWQRCETLEPFKKALPEVQIDAPPQ